MFLTTTNKQLLIQIAEIVAIPSNRVNVSYELKNIKINEDGVFVAIPSNRVNVSYAILKMLKMKPKTPGRNPLKSGQCFLPERQVKPR